MTMLLSQPAILSTFSPVEISYITLSDKQYITVYISCQWVNVKNVGDMQKPPDRVPPAVLQVLYKIALRAVRSAFVI